MEFNINYIYVLVALLLGVYQSFIYKKTGPATQNFLTTLAILPMLVSLVLLCINGNVGSSIAILGVFSLIRFRSIQGNSKEILNIFYSMTIGILCISGNIIFAIIISIIIGLVILLFYRINLFKTVFSQIIKITIPENLNYEEIFDTILKEYTDSYKLLKIRTINMGSLFELNYEIKVKKEKSIKSLMDEIRCKNANLNVSVYNIDTDNLQL